MVIHQYSVVIEEYSAVISVMYCKSDYTVLKERSIQYYFIISFLVVKQQRCSAVCTIVNAAL